MGYQTIQLEMRGAVCVITLNRPQSLNALTLELMPHVMALAEKLANAPTAAIGKIKELLEASATNDYAGQLELERKAQIQLGQTKDFREGVAAFIEKRPSKFVGG
ncbi:hypothetical protein BH18ACI4_BH18ACI4_10820 [soil metagenome]